jgi:hypothetical protein
MGKIRKYMKEKRSHAAASVAGGIRFILNFCEGKFRIRGRIRLLNRSASHHGKGVVAMTASLLSVLFILNIIYPILSPSDKVKEESLAEDVSSIENIIPTFDRLSSIELSKKSQKMETVAMIQRGVDIKSELDSLMALAVITHNDSVAIATKYRQLSIISKTLNQHYDSED